MKAIANAAIWATLLVVLTAAPGHLGASEIKPAPILKVIPERALVDEPVEITIEGLNAGEHVTVQATLHDHGGSDWSSHAIFAANESGRVIVAKQAPVEGTYEGVDAMGLFWSMVRLRETKEDPEFFAGQVEPGQGMTMVFKATAPGRPPAETAIQRMWADSSIVRETVREDGLFGTFYYPADSEPVAAILHPHGGFCLMPEKPAAVLASRGFAVLALKYCGEDGLPENTGSEIALEYFETAMNWLQARPETASGKIGVVGMSLGGTLALLLGSRFEQVGAAVSIKGSGVIVNFKFTQNGEPVPATRMQGTEILADALRAAQRPECRPESPGGEWSCYNWETTHFMFVLFHGFAEPDALYPGVIPVERINGPVMLVSGFDDQSWPSTLYSEVAFQRLKDNEFTHKFEHLAYPGAGHRLGIAHLPRTDAGVDWHTWGGNARDAGAANADYWPKMIEFLRNSLETRATEATKRSD